MRLIGGDEGATRVMIGHDGAVPVESPDTQRLTGKPGLVPMTSSVTASFRARNRQDFAGLDGIDGLDWHADPKTGSPLGSVERIGDQRNVRRLTTWERLKPTPPVLAHLDISGVGG